MILSSTSDIVRIVTTTTSDIDVQAGWADQTTTEFTPGRTNTAISTATTTTIVGSPAASTQRQVKTITIKNNHATTSNQVTVQHYDGVTSVEVYEKTLLAGESLVYNGASWQPYNSEGDPLIVDTALGSLVGFNIPKHDTRELGYTSGNLTTVVYKLEGSTVATKTLTYTDGVLTSVVVIVS